MSYVTGNQKIKTDFSANGQILPLNVAGLNSVRFEFSGTYALTGIFESSNNSTNGIDGVWFPVLATRVDASTNSLSHATANATSAYEASCHNDNWVRIRLTAFTSASLNNHRVAIIGSVAAIEPIPAIVFPTTQAVSLSTGSAISVTTTASTNASVQKNTSGNLFDISISNPSATAVSVKLYNKATAPTVGTDIPVLTQVVPGGGTVSLSFGNLGKRFALGIGLAATALPAANDTGAAVAGVQIHGTYL